MAEWREGTVAMESVSVRNSVPYDSGLDGETWEGKRGSEGIWFWRAVMLGSSHWSFTSRSRRAVATFGQIVERSDSWIRRVSALLQAEG